VGQPRERVMSERLLAIWPMAGAEGIVADYARVLATGESNVRELLYEHDRGGVGRARDPGPVRPRRHGRAGHLVRPALRARPGRRRPRERRPELRRGRHRGGAGPPRGRAATRRQRGRSGWSGGRCGAGRGRAGEHRRRVLPARPRVALHVRQRRRRAAAADDARAAARAHAVGGVPGRRRCVPTRRSCARSW
jgi:hypothetical protein